MALAGLATLAVVVVVLATQQGPTAEAPIVCPAVIDDGEACVMSIEECMALGFDPPVCPPGWTPGSGCGYVETEVYTLEECEALGLEPPVCPPNWRPGNCEGRR